MDKLTSEDLVMAILIRYSNPDRDETHCRMSELKHDLVRLIAGYKRQADDVQEMHDAWLRLCRENAEANRPLLQRLLRRA